MKRFKLALIKFLVETDRMVASDEAYNSKYTKPLGLIIRLYQILFHSYADDSQLMKMTLSI